MNPHSEKAGYSRRQFVERLARGTVLAGAAVVGARPALAAEKNPFAYDVSRFSRTDPALIGWEEVARRTCPGKGLRRLATGPDDTLYVAAEREVVSLRPDGSVGRTEVGGVATCVAVAADGVVYVGLRDRVEVYDPQGRRLAVWSEGDRRTWLSSLAVGEAGVWAADAGHRLILHYDRSGRVVGRIGAKDPARSVPGLIVPSPNLEVKMHPDGLLRVNNPGRHRYEAYTLDGGFAGAWGSPSLAVTGFCGCCNPVGLAVLPDGRVVTCEKGLPRVKVFGVDGTFESVAAGTETFAANVKACADPGDCTKGGLDVAVDSRGRIHVLDRVTAEVRTLQPKRARA